MIANICVVTVLELIQNSDNENDESIICTDLKKN